MSAWIVPKVHIDLLVHAISEGTRDGVIPGRPINRRQLGQMLVDENVASVSYRYPDDKPGELPGPTGKYAYYLKPYRFTNPKYRLTAAELAKAVNCYDYQSCEHPGWEHSAALGLCRDILAELGRKVADARRLLEPILAGSQWPAYEAAPWGFGTKELVKLRRVAAREPLPADLRELPDYAAADWLAEHDHAEEAAILRKRVKVAVE